MLLYVTSHFISSQTLAMCFIRKFDFSSLFLHPVYILWDIRFCMQLNIHRLCMTGKKFCFMNIPYAAKIGSIWSL